MDTRFFAVVLFNCLYSLKFCMAIVSNFSWERRPTRNRRQWLCKILGRNTSPGGRVVLRISGDGNDGRIFGFKIFYSGIFLVVGKFGWLDLSRDFLGIQNNLKIRACE